jgi:flagellar export protein FliJ
MKKFKFTLQTVHNVREIHQEKEKLVLSARIAEVDTATSNVVQLEKKRTEAIEKYSRQLNSGEQLNAMEMQLYSNHLAALHRLRQEAGRVLAEKNHACLQQGKKVTASMHEVKVTDRLREAQKTRHYLASTRMEQTISDELVSARFARQLIHTK